MYTAQQTLFLYAISPVHMGAGTALGLIDNPIQREKHTEHPVAAGSGLKGAVRHRFWAQGSEAQEKVKRYFGPDTQASEYAGAVSFSDAQLVAFPIRCTKEGFVYATSPAALARAQRLLAHTGTATSWNIPQPNQTECATTPGCKIKTDSKVQLDTFELAASDSDDLAKIAEFLSQHTLPQKDEYEFFRNKLQKDLVVINDTEFSYFVKNATLVEPHVRIDNKTGTAEGTGLFYTENLPPESILIATLMASDERSNSGNKDNNRAAASEIIKEIIMGSDDFNGLNEQLLQIGGDATTGRGQVVITAVKGDE